MCQRQTFSTIVSFPEVQNITEVSFVGRKNPNMEH